MKVFSAIEELYLREFGSTAFRSTAVHFDKNKMQISFYHAAVLEDIEFLKKNVKNVVNDIIRFVPENYFYKIVKIQYEIIDKNIKLQRFDTVLVTRILVDEIEKKPKNAHISQINRLKDLYV